MKLTTIILITTLLQVSAAGMAQQFTLKKKNVSLKQVFKEIRKQTGYSILWESENFDADKKISVDFNSSSLKDILNSLFSKQGYNYVIDENTIIIQNEPIIKTGFKINSAETITVVGKVVDDYGQPVGGASIIVKITGKGVSTKADGTFEISGVEEGSILLIKHVGFQVKEFPATKRAGVLQIKAATNELDAVQIQAYGVTSKRLSTSNISTIRADEIDKQPVSNPLLALQGRIPGLVVTPVSGFSGGSVTVRIQGYNSIRGGNNPFYVVDGVPYSSFLVTPNTTMNSIWGSQETVGRANPQLSGEGSGSPLNYINPSDIESIEILKDADATAIYGSKAANGAIIITTKKGKSGPLKVEGSLKSGFDKITQTANFLSYDQYRQVRLEARRNNNQAILATDYDLNGFWGNEILNRDYQRELLSRSVANHNAQISAFGGTNESNYRINIGFQSLNGIIKNDLKDEKVSLGFNLNSSSVNKKFKLGLSFFGMLDDNRLPSENPILSILALPPNSPSLYNTNGTLNWALDATGRSTWDNPLAKLERSVRSKVKNLNTNLNLSYEFLPNLKFLGNIGYNLMDMENLEKWPASYREPAQLDPLSRQVGKDNLQSSSYIIEPQLSFAKQVGNFKLDFLLGGTIQSSTNKGNGIISYGFPSDSQMDNLAIATGTVQNGTVSRIYNYNAGFIRLNINRNDEFLLNLTARRDGSSRFGDNNRFQNFAAIGAGWIFSEREWIKENLPFISFGKIKTSYGVTGSDQIGDYTYLDLNRVYSVNIPYQGISAINNSGLYNADLQWERNRKLNFGLDLNFLNDRIQVSGNYAINRSDNLLMQVTLPSNAGVAINSGASINLNFPGLVENRSRELTILTRNVQGKKIGWQTSINITQTSNTLKSIGDPTILTAGLGDLAVGQSIRSRFVAHFYGVDPLTGTARIADANGNPSSDVSSIPDKSKYVDLIPNYTGGISNTLSYKGLTLDVFLQFQRQNRERYVPGVNYGNEKVNLPSIVENRWQNPGDVATMIKAGSSGQGYATLFDASFEDSSFIRVKNVAFSWELPSVWTKKIGLRQLRATALMQNLWTLTNYSGLDPETGVSFLPLPRTIVFGLNVGL